MEVLNLQHSDPWRHFHFVLAGHGYYRHSHVMPRRRGLGSPYTPVPQSFWLILHSSEARFISSGHLRKTIVSQSDESDLCLSTIGSVSDLHLVP